MSRPGLSIVLSLILPILGLSSVGARAGSIEGTWEAKAKRSADRIRLRLRTDGDRYSLEVPTHKLEGLEPTQLRRSGAPLHFEWTRPSGRLVFEGEGAWFFVAGGTFSFEPDRTFAESAGEGLTDADLYRAAMHSIPAEIFLRMQELGYELQIEDVVRLESRGIDLDYVEGMQVLGYRPSVDQLVRLRNHGLTPRTVQAFADVGFEDLAIDNLIRLRNHGVDPGYAANLSPENDLDLDRVIRLHQHGIRADYVADLSEMGYGDTDVLIRLSNYGVRARWIAELRELGYGELSLDELIRLNVHGVDANFVRRLVELGYDDLSVDEIVNIRNRGGLDSLPPRRKAA